MAFQFIHLEAYSRKSDKGGRTVSFILDEADRQSHACVHVDDPEPPTVVHGCTISDLRAIHDAAVSGAKTVNKDGKEKAIRIDQKTLLTVIASHPFTVGDCKSDASKMAEYEAWERDTIKWLHNQYGDNLKSVVRHSDESHMHIHAYVLPEDLKALEIHPGVSAKRKEKAAALDRGEDGKTANKSGDQAYKESMRNWQDAYFDQVAVRHGLARLGPKLRRLSRGEWQREKAASQALKKSLNRAENLNSKAQTFIEDTKKKAFELIDKAKADAAIAKANADVAAKKKLEADALVKQAQDRARKINLLNQRVQKTHLEASNTLEKARSEAKSILSAASEKARYISGFGGFLRSLYDGFRKSKIRENIESEYEDRINQIDRDKNDVMDKLFIAREERDKYRNENNNLRISITGLSHDLRNTKGKLKKNNIKDNYNNTRKMKF